VPGPLSNYPGGKSGVGLLLLRAAIGGTAVFQGVRSLMDRGNPTTWTVLIACVTIGAGACLLLGFLTPVAAALAGLGATLINASPGLPIAILATTIILLGPGALSVDSLLFGRRQILIPRLPR
jgi:uncharacterized membrane protein YphA (DoxX/SURF4 family)